MNGNNGKNRTHGRCLRAGLVAVALLRALSASAADKVTYNDHVLPIFRNACLNCHNPDKKKAGLDLSTYQGTLQGSENGKVLQSGSASDSLLFKCIKGSEDPKMPPKGDRVSDGEMAVIEKWINGQLLESASGSAVALAKNNVQVAVVSLERPAGPPPMPGELPMEPVVRTKALNALVALAASPWAPVVAVGGQKQVVLYHTETLEPLGVLPFPEGFPAILKFSRNGQILLIGGGQGGKSGRVALWDIRTGERIGTVGNEFDQVLAADLSADQQFVAVGGPNKLVKIYATKDGKLVTSIKKHTDWVTALAFSPDGKYLASADRNGGIQVWEGATGTEFTSLPGHKAMVSGLAFMTGVLASASEDGKVSLWDIKEGKEIRSWTAHQGGAAWVDFTPDGRLVTCGRDKEAKVWDQNGKQIGKAAPFGDIALRAALSGDRIIAGDWTGTIRVSALDGKPVGELSANPPAIADRLAAAEKVLADAQGAMAGLSGQLTEAETKFNAEKVARDAETKAAAEALEKLKTQPAELEQRLAAENVKLAELRTARDAAPEEGKAGVQEQVDAQKARVAATESELGKAKADLQAKLSAPKVEPKALAGEAEVAKAREALEKGNALLAAATAQVERWKMAQMFQGVHNARLMLADKQAQLEALTQAAKDAASAAERIQSDLAAAEKAGAAAPAQFKEKETLLASAQAAAAPLAGAVKAAESALADKTKVLSSLSAAPAQPQPDKAAELAKRLEVQSAELTKLRDARGTQPAESPAYADADQKVQAKKAEIAEVEAALAAVRAAPPQNDEASKKAALAEVAQAKDALEKAKADAQVAAQKVTAAEQAVAVAKKAAAQSTAKLAELKAKAPEALKAARQAKVEAEQGAAATQKELAAAKTEAERRRTAYEAQKAARVKAAPAAPATTGKS